MPNNEKIYSINLSHLSYFNAVLYKFLGVPVLLNLTEPVKYRNQERTVMITLEGSGYPFPSTFQWSKDGEGPLQNDSRRMFGYPNLIIGRVEISDSGRYSLSATNHIPGNPPQLLGTGNGSFTLDVLRE